MNLDDLRRKSAQIRRLIFEAVVKAGKGHIGGAFSSADILVTLYHGGALRHDPRNPAWEHRDRFILGKGHAAVSLYAVLADRGFFDPAELMTLCGDGSRLGEHPARNVPGVDVDTGSLGVGIGVAAGLALSAKMGGHPWRTFVLLGDGECHEGSVWETMMFAAHHHLDNLTAIIDRNLQITLDFTEDCLRLEPLAEKLSAFGWAVTEIDGHCHKEISGALSQRPSGKPLAIVARTIKGKGVSFMEGQLKWHHGMPNQDQAALARQELERACQ